MPKGAFEFAVEGGVRKSGGSGVRKRDQGLKVTIDYLKDSSRDSYTCVFSTDALNGIEANRGIPENPKPGFYFEWVNAGRRGHILRAKITAPHSITENSQDTDYRTLTAEIGVGAVLQFVSKALLEGDLKIEADQLSDLLIALGNALKNSGK